MWIITIIVGDSDLYYGDDEIIGHSGSGTFTQTGGTHAVLDNLSIGQKTGSIGEYNLSGTGSLSADDEIVGYSGSGTFNAGQAVAVTFDQLLLQLLLQQAPSQFGTAADRNYRWYSLVGIGLWLDATGGLPGDDACQ